MKPRGAIASAKRWIRFFVMVLTNPTETASFESVRWDFKALLLSQQKAVVKEDVGTTRQKYRWVKRLRINENRSGKVRVPRNFLARPRCELPAPVRCTTIGLDLSLTHFCDNTVGEIMSRNLFHRFLVLSFFVTADGITLASGDRGNHAGSADDQMGRRRPARQGAALAEYPRPQMVRERLAEPQRPLAARLRQGRRGDADRQGTAPNASSCRSPSSRPCRAS